MLTTTLVDRTDSSNLVTLDRDEPVRHRGMDLVFTGVDLVEADDDDYEVQHR